MRELPTGPQSVASPDPASGSAQSPLFVAPPVGARLVPRDQRSAHGPEDLERLLNICINLNVSTDLTGLLYRILDGAKEMMLAEDASIMLLDPVTQMLGFAAIDSPFRDALQNVLLKLGEGIAGWVAQQGEVVIADDAYSDPRFSTKGDDASGHRTSNMICLPLKTKDHTIGTLQVINRRGGRYTAEDVPLCLSLANMAAIAIENVRLQERTERDLERIQQLQEKRTEFINIMSHELRTPLTIVQGGLDILRSGMELDEETRREFLDSMSSNTARLKRLVDDIFIVNDIEMLRENLIVREVDLAHLVRLFQHSYDYESNAPRLVLDLPHTDDPFVVPGDREKLMHCVAHLLDNARKFSEPGGTVTVSLAADERLRSMRVTVRDEGIGVAEELQERIFERFYQVDASLTRRYGGTGIGLYICRKVVEAHGGMIWCHSKPGEGSEFAFALPWA